MVIDQCSVWGHWCANSMRSVSDVRHWAALSSPRLQCHTVYAILLWLRFIYIKFESIYWHLTVFQSMWSSVTEVLTDCGHYSIFIWLVPLDHQTSHRLEIWWLRMKRRQMPRQPWPPTTSLLCWHPKNWLNCLTSTGEVLIPDCADCPNIVCGSQFPLRTYPPRRVIQC